ncbi:MAG TPA: ribonuclease [Sphingobium sp.]|uniref:ribonuclease n=1 Tax=Sphingobium sp. TaxID=1912891 RepID=UPI002ED204A5
MSDIPQQTHWLYEDGVGEARAALVAGGRILEGVIERPGAVARAGAFLSGRLVETIIPRKRGIARLDNGEEVLIEPIPPKVAEGSTILVEIFREAIAEHGLDGIRPKRATGRVALPGSRAKAAPTLAERIEASDYPVHVCQPHEDDWLEQCGWSELLDEAMSGEIVREDASLRIFPTPAMTLIDVDGVAPPAQLGPKGAKLGAQAIRRMGLAGSIGIDLPTMNNKDERLIAAAQIDKYLPLPFERTAVNGFGFVQVIRRRERASLMEVLRGDPVLTAALAALRLADRHGGGVGAVTLTVAPDVARLIARTPEWARQIDRRRGGALTVVGDAALERERFHAG